MISTTSVESLCIYCQNVGCKHNWTINLLEWMKSNFDILFLQEPPWVTDRYTTSLTEKDGVPAKGPQSTQIGSPLTHKGLTQPKINCVSLLI
jgi:hypothetical protein